MNSKLYIEGKMYLTYGANRYDKNEFKGANSYTC